MGDTSTNTSTVNVVDSEGNVVEATEHGEMKVLSASLVMYDQIEGVVLNTNIWTPSSSTMTITQSGGFINLNAANSVAANAYALILSNKVVPFYGEQEVELSTSVMLSALPDANEVIEVGFMTCAGASAPTDGVFIRIQGGVAKGVMSFGGVETTILMNSPIPGMVQDFDISVDSFNAHYEIDGTKTTMQVPTNFPFPTSIARQQVCYRIYNTGTPPVAGVKFSVGRMEVTQALITVNKPWPEILCEMARSSFQSPTTFGTTCNYANNAAPASAVLSNTVPSYTTLDGQFKFAAVAGAETDYALFGFQVPAGYQFKCSHITIDTFVEGLAVASPTSLQWAVGLNSTAASLATVDGAGTVAPRRKTLGVQTFLALAGIGSVANDIDRTFDPPLVVDSGRWFHIILKIPDGAATALLVFRGVVGVSGFFE